VEPAATSTPLPPEGGPEELDRAPYRRRLLAALDGGRLDVPEYARRCQALNAAASVELLDAIVADVGPVTVGNVTVESVTDATVDAALDDTRLRAGRGLDPVDLALMERGTRVPGPARTRVFSLAVMVVFLVVLLAVGVYLATHVHAVSSGAASVVSGVRSAGPVGLGARLVSG